MTEVVKAKKPTCSRCCREVAAVVAFLAFASESAMKSRHRGASRSVRLCGRCLQEMARALGD